METLHKKIVQINSVLNGSTGRIANQIALYAQKFGFDVCVYAPKSRTNQALKTFDFQKLFGTRTTRNISKIIEQRTGFSGALNIFNTCDLIRKLKKEKPDLIHIHNIHDSCVNITLLFRYIKRNNINVVWTLHDCWSFTGRCPYFTIVGCDKWKTGCYRCEYPKKHYPVSLIDQSRKVWKKKKKLFTSIQNLVLITPSNWLANLVKESYFGNCDVRVIHNGIDLEMFHPIESDFREKYNIQNKFVILGVAFGWGYRKGLDVFVQLYHELDPEKFQIVLVGTDDSVDLSLPNGIISIHQTDNQQELVKIYSASDVFFNPTREEVLGLVNLEANACGTPVIMFNTGGSPECITERSGIVLSDKSIQTCVKAITEFCDNPSIKKDDCIHNASIFSMENKYKEYVSVYRKMVDK